MANQVGAFGGQLAALQRAFDDYKESAFSVDEDSDRSKTREKRRSRKTMKAAEDATNIAASREDAASQLTTEKQKTNANTARRSAHTRGNMTKKNVSTTKSIKDGVPAKYARNWTLNSNVARNILLTWVDLRAGHRKKAVVAAKATVVTPAMNDGVGARMMENGLRSGDRKLTNL